VEISKPVYYRPIKKFPKTKYLSIIKGIEEKIGLSVVRLKSKVE
jgi:hypothetical protein